MKKGRFLKKMMAYVLSMCMLSAGLFTTDCNVVQAEETITTVYFYLEEDWSEVGVHVYKEETGKETINYTEWGTQTATPVSGEDGWYQYTVAGTPQFTVQVYDQATKDNPKYFWYSDDTGKLYATSTDSSARYATLAEAKAALNAPASGPVTSTTVYFYLEEDWSEVGVHVYKEETGKETINYTEWGTQTATPVSGEDGWYQYTVAGTPQFTVQVYDQATKDNPKYFWYSDDTGKLYATSTDSSARYATLAEAKAALNPPASDPETADGSVFYIYYDSAWESTCAYGWADGVKDTTILGGWPGSELESMEYVLGENWWKVETNGATGFNLILNNNNNGAQIDTAYVTAENNYVVVAGDKNATSYSSYAEASDALYPNAFYIYYNSAWESTYAYGWGAEEGDDGTLGGWPGSKLESMEYVLGENWWRVETNGATGFNLILNNNNNGAQIDTAYVTAENNYVVVAGDKNATSYSSYAEASDALYPNAFYIKYNTEWDTTYAYGWANGADDITILGVWPGSELKSMEYALGKNWWKAETNGATAFNLIMNNNNGSQFDAAYVTAEDNYVVIDANKVSTLYPSYAAASGVAVEAPKVYVYYTGDWESLYIYGYHNTNKDSDVFGGWPGKKIETAVDTMGENWKMVETNGATGFTAILNDGTDISQTAGFDITSDNKYIVYTAEHGPAAYSSQLEAEMALGLIDSTRVYFYNVYGYENVKVHGWNNAGDLFSPQPLAKREAADSNWYYIDVPAKTPFNLQFIDGESGEMQQSYIAGENLYLATTDKCLSSKTAVEEYMNNMKTTIYFLNYNGDTTPFGEVYAHVYIGDTPIEGTSWPGIKAEKANIGDNWWQLEVPANGLLTPFNVIFNDGDGNQLPPVEIDYFKSNYVTLKGDGKVYTAQDSAEISAGIKVETVVYLLNDNNWENTSVYIYGRPGEALGGWPGEAPVAAPELGDKWQKITIPAKTPFNIIYFNSDTSTERTEMLLSSEYNLYVTGSGAAYGSQFEAEAACGMIDQSELAVIYFYNSRNWGDINAYTYKIIGEDKPTLGAEWPGSPAEKAPEIGENWWKIRVPMKASAISESNKFGIIFNDGVNQMPDGSIISDPTKIYTIPTEEVFATPEEAEEAAAKDNYDDGCEEGPNADYNNYRVTYSGAGAALPYKTYEAENASTNGDILAASTAYRQDIQSEASGRQAVKLDATGEYVEFTLTKPANALVLRYSIPDTSNGLGQDATLSCYINGTKNRDLNVTSRYAWVYGSFPFFNTPNDGGPHRYYDELRVLFDDVMPAGTTIKLQKDAGDSAEYYVIDFIEMENVGAPLSQPENSISVTDFGAIANDGLDDRAAFEACIEAAKMRGQTVWIPAGNFDLNKKECFTVSGVTIRGAGMWYTNLNGAGAAFKYHGTAKFYDFAMTGVSTIRDDSGDLAGFEGNGSRATNVTIQNIWMEHMKVGVWSCNSENLIIQGCRIRNTFADGINLCSATHDAVVRNNHLRNTGDDAIASWPWLANCTGNVITHNTIQVPTLANGVAIYGGGGFVVDNNYVADTICNGAGVVVGSEFQTPKSFTGTVTVKNNVIDRCGSMQVDEGYPIGAIWIWSSTRFANNNMNATFNISNNVMNNCAQTGITIECGNDLTGVNIQNNTINGATDAVHEYYPGGPGTGSGKISNLKISNITGVKWKDDAPNFTLTWVNDNGGNKQPEGNTGSEGSEGNSTNNGTGNSANNSTDNGTGSSTDNNTGDASKENEEGASDNTASTDNNSAAKAEDNAPALDASGETATPAGVELSEQKVTETVEEIMQVIEAVENNEGQDEAQKQVIVLDMKNEDGTQATVVPTEVLEAVKGHDIDIVLEMDGYSWTINGSDITAEQLSAINLEVKVGVDVIPSDHVQALAGDNPSKQISLTHNGEFGFGAKLTVYLGTENTGLYGNLYYYDADGRLVYMSTEEIDADGNATFNFTHASDYLVVLGEKVVSEEGTVFVDSDGTLLADADSTDAAKNDAGTDESADDTTIEVIDDAADNNTVVIVIVVILVIALAAIAYFATRRNKEQDI